MFHLGSSSNDSSSKRHSPTTLPVAQPLSHDEVVALRSQSYCARLRHYCATEEFGGSIVVVVALICACIPAHIWLIPALHTPGDGVNNLQILYLRVNQASGLPINAMEAEAMD